MPVLLNTCMVTFFLAPFFTKTFPPPRTLTERPMHLHQAKGTRSTPLMTEVYAMHQCTTPPILLGREVVRGYMPVDFTRSQHYRWEVRLVNGVGISLCFQSDGVVLHMRSVRQILGEPVGCVYL